MHYNLEAGAGFDLFSYLKNPEVFDVKDGMIDIMTGPGLGVEMNEELIRKCAEDPQHRDFSWRNPVWRGPDGGLREW